MDLGAYVNIANLEPLLKENGIKDIKRLRGLRLMQFEKPVTEEEIQKMIRSESKTIVEWFFKQDGYGCLTFSNYTDWLTKYFVADGQPRWNRIHGKYRKKLKFELKKVKKRIRAQFDIWNKYAGRDDILYIHTRTGGSNWAYYGCNEYYNTDWFIEKVDDYFDSTYCDIYAKIEPVSEERLKELAKEENEEEN